MVSELKSMTEDQSNNNRSTYKLEESVIKEVQVQALAQIVVEPKKSAQPNAEPDSVALRKGKAPQDEILEILDLFSEDTYEHKPT